jgi:hypothetical protein
MADDDDVVKRIIARHGDTIDLRESPEVIIDIIRSFRSELRIRDAGTPPPGIPDPGPAPVPAPTPAPAPGPTATPALGPTNSDLLRAVLKLAKQVAALEKQLDR